MLHWTATVYGKSGRAYPVIIPRYLVDLPKSPGIYYKMKQMPDGFLWKIYVGQADDVYRRNLIDDHSADGHKRAADLGANIVGFTHAPRDGKQRCAWETDIIGLYDPPANIKKTAGLGALLARGVVPPAAPASQGLLAGLAGVLSGIPTSPPTSGLLAGGLASLYSK